MTSGRAGRYAPRFWRLSDGTYAFDADGYLADREGLVVYSLADLPTERTRIYATAELVDWRCLVLLGEPGAGKTSVITAEAPLLPPGVRVPVVTRDLGLYGSEDRVVADLLDGPDIARWRDSNGELCLVLDAFDESHVPNLARLFSHYISRWPTDRLYLRIACRVAEWPRTLADELDKAFGDVGMFELLPLRRRDVAAFLPDGTDVAAFLDAVRLAHAEPLAMWPLTLGLLARLFVQTGTLPERAADLYARGLLSLCDEQNPLRRDAGATGSHSPAERLAAARRIAAASIFGGRPVVWTGPLSEGNDALLSTHDCEGGTEPCSSGQVELTPPVVREALHTGLFTGQGSQRLGWTHATFADYLAGEWVVANELTREHDRSLFFSSDGHIYPQLRHAAAWAVAIAPERHGWMVAEDPESFLGQADIPDDALRATVVDGLLQAAADGRYQAEYVTSYEGSLSRVDDAYLATVLHEMPQVFAKGRHPSSYQGLRHAKLAWQLRPRLHDQHTDVRLLAIAIAEGCRVKDLMPDFTAIALDPAEGIRERLAAARAVWKVAPGTAALLPLVKDVSVLGDDPDDELLGTALSASWPHALSTREALAVVRAPSKRYLIGNYGWFLDVLARSLCDEDLPAVLGWMANADDAPGNELITHFSVRAMRLIVRRLDDERAFRVVRDIARRRDMLFRFLLARNRDWSIHEPVEAPAAGRRQLVLSLLDEDGDPVRAIAEFGYEMGLITATDLAWLVEQYAAATPGQRHGLWSLMQSIIHGDNLGYINAILKLPASHPLVLDHASDFPQPRGFDDAKKPGEQTKAPGERQHQYTHSDDQINSWIVAHIDAAIGGDPARFRHAARLVAVHPGTRSYEGRFQQDLTTHPRWQLLDPELKDRTLQAAIIYLRAGHCEPGRRPGQRSNYHLGEAGYRALLLLARLKSASLAELEPSVWRHWAPIMIGSTANFYRGWDERQLLLSHARKHALSVFCDALVGIVRASAEADEPLRISEGCQAMWCDALANEFIVLAQQPMPPRTHADLLEIIICNDAARARPLLLSWLEDSARTEDADRAKRAGQLLFRHEVATTWPTLHRLLLGDPEFGKDVILAAASPTHQTAWLDLLGSPVDSKSREDAIPGGPPDLPSQLLADLYLWLAEHFPRTQDPPFGEQDSIGPRNIIIEWRDGILEYLKRRGTQEAVAAVHRIADAFPAESRLRLHVTAAEEALRSRSWTPLSPAHLQRLAADHRTRLVRSAADLLHLVADALDVIQQRLQADTPEAQLLWDTRIRRPKTEDEASDYLRQRLTDLLSRRGVVVFREVQVRRIQPVGIPERTDLRIDATAPSPEVGEASITVVGEVKAAWNPGLMTAMQSQLASRYMTDIGTAYGLYIVLWFDPSWWAADQGQSDRNRMLSLNRKSMLTRLREQARTLAAQGFHIAVVLLDMSYERPQPTGRKP